MKKLMLPVFAVVLFGTTFASENYTREPIPFSVSVFKSFEDPLGYKGLPVSVDIMLKDTNGVLLFTEKHETTLNNLAEFKINIGQGTNQHPSYDQANFRALNAYCYTVTVHDPGGDIVLMNTDYSGQSSACINAETAHNSDALGHNILNNTELKTEDILKLNTDLGKFKSFVNLTDQGPNEDVNTIQPYSFNNIIGVKEAPSAVHIDTPITYVAVGTGIHFPVVFTNQAVAKLENYYTICPQDPENFYNGFGVKMPNTGIPNTHSTASIYGENVFDALGVGGFFNGANRGSYNQGQTGAFGICNNTTGNGTGVWGYVLNAPEAGAGNYGILGSSNGFPNALAAFLMGNVLYTGNLTGPSDRNLKTNIRTASAGLSTILQLRSTTFNYIQNTPYSFPAGEHHGFIAQEVETLLPEIVEDIIYPLDTDPTKMGSGGSTTYKGINYMELIPILTTAMQELNAKVDAQAAEIEILKEELKALQHK